MRYYKRYIVRDKVTKKIVTTVIVEVGSRLPKVEKGLYVAECCGRFEKESVSK